MAILNKSNYYDQQQQNGKVCARVCERPPAWMKRDAQHIVDGFVAIALLIVRFDSIYASGQGVKRKICERRTTTTTTKATCGRQRQVKVLGWCGVPSSVCVSFECKLLPIFHRR